LWINGIPTGLSWSQTVHYDDESHFDRPLLITPNFNSTSEPIPSNYRNPRIQFDKDLPANVFARLVRVPLDRKNNPAMVAVIDNVNDTDQEVKIAFNYGSQPIKLGDPNDIDSDDDGLKDGFEIKVFKTNAFSSDTDEDGMNDYWEVVFGTDPKQKDSHIGNDGDSLSNYEEMLMGYHPWITDTDRDGTPDGEEDKDGDGLTFIQEWRLGLNDNDIDSDNDLLPDGYEISIGKDPTKKDDLSDRNLYPDTDGEGLPDILEVPEAYGTDPTLTDTDGDGISDYDEVFKYKSDPTNFDTDGDLIPDGVEVSVDGWNLLIPDDLEGDLDGDGVSNLQEIIYGGNPNLADTDGDGTSDYDEITQGSYINDASDNGELSDEEKENQITVKLRVGDPSGSHSERMIAIVSELNENVEERVLLNHQNKEYGTVTADNISIFKNFRKNKSYSIQLKHVGTDPSIKEKYKKNMVSYNRGFPNYDWLLEGSVINKDGSEVPLSNYFVILDPWDPLEKKVPMGATSLMGKYQTAPYGKNNKQHFIDNFENRRVLLMPVDLVTDLNNDGQINAQDRNLRDASFEDGASDEDIEKGTEYLFYDDDIRNGAEYAEEEEDDDLDRLKIEIPFSADSISDKYFWFEFDVEGEQPTTPITNILTIYSDNKKSFSWSLSESQRATEGLLNLFNEGDVYLGINADTETPQIDGVLTFKLGNEDRSSPIEIGKIRYRFIKEVGAENYFDAARDYIYENNCEWHFARTGGTDTFGFYVASFAEELLDFTPHYGYGVSPPNKSVMDVATDFGNQYDLIINAQTMTDADVETSDPISNAKVNGEFIVSRNLLDPPSIIPTPIFPARYLGFDPNTNKFEIKHGAQMQSTSDPIPSFHGMGGLSPMHFNQQRIINGGAAGLGISKNNITDERSFFATYSFFGTYFEFREKLRDSSVISIGASAPDDLALINCDPRSASAFVLRGANNSKIEIINNDDQDYDFEDKDDDNTISKKEIGGRHTDDNEQVYSYMLFNSKKPR
jgi:hypothetical protein